MRILYVSHYFYPEGNAPGTRVYEMTRRWAAQGHEVTVITAAPSVPDGVVYDGYENACYSREQQDGVDVIRVWTYLAANQGTTRRIVNFLSFMATATLAGLFVRRPDVVIATSPQFFCGWVGVLLRVIRRLRFVLEIRDLWPESIVAVGALGPSRLIRFLEFLERQMYAAATQIVTVGEGYRRGLVERGVDPERIEVIPNGVDLKVFRARAADARVREEWDLGERFVCAYVGTIGMGSGLDVVLRAARTLREQDRDDIRFLLVGDGAIRGELEQRARAEGLSQVVFTGRQEKSRMPDLLAASDACLVHLRRTPLFESVLPSKIFEASAMERPIILGVAGFAAELVDGAEAGICIEPENETQLLEAVTRLAADPDLAKRLGSNGRERIAERYSYDNLAREYLANLDKLIAGGTSR